MTSSLSTPPAIVAPSAGFQMPPVSMGMIVLWMRPGREEHDRCSAIVQRVNGDNTLALSRIFSPQGGVQHISVEQSCVAVMHRDDPRLQSDYRLRYGCWDLTDHEKQYRELQAEVGRLSRKQK